MKNYIVIESDELKSFQSSVTNFVRQGWQLEGGIAVTAYETDDKYGKKEKCHYYQAMTKDVD